MEYQVLADEALGYGLGVFETMRVEDGHVIWLCKHMERLKKSAKIIGIKNLERLDGLDFEKEIQRAKEEFGNIFVLKLLLTENQIYLGHRRMSYQSSDYEKGFSICTSQVRRNEASMWTGIKSLHYGDSILEKRKAQEKGFLEALFLNSKGELAECSMSNIFWVKEGQIYTPSLSCGLLPGVMRAFVLEKRNVQEIHAAYEQILQADEVFLTNSVMEVMGVHRLDGKEYSSMATANEIRKELQSCKGEYQSSTIENNNGSFY